MKITFHLKKNNKIKPNSHPSLGRDGMCAGMWTGKYVPQRVQSESLVPIILVVTQTMKSLRKKYELGKV